MSAYVGEKHGCGDILGEDSLKGRVIHDEDVGLFDQETSSGSNFVYSSSSKENNKLEDLDDLESSNDKENFDSHYRTCSWQHMVGLMLSEYIVLAIMSFPWSYSVLGLVPGLILTVGVASSVLYTGLIIADFCERFPHLKNMCDIGQYLFGGHAWAWYVTAFCFLTNNILIESLHVLVGAKYLNTITNHSMCSVAFTGIVTGLSFVCSLPRTFSSLSMMGYIAAIAMFIAVILAMIFSGVQTHPEGYDGTPVTFRAFPAEGTTFVDGMSAFLNIVYSFVGQITYPQFISEMKNPKEFKKVLWIVTLCQIMIFSFAVPSILFAGAMYANISAKFVFFSIIPRNSVHRYANTKTSLLIWSGLLLFVWVGAFVAAEVIPFFSDLLALMSSLFDCWFGFVFWGVAYIKLRKLDYGPKFNVACLTGKEKIQLAIAIGLIGVGLYMLGPGLYASVQSIINNYRLNAYGTSFSCASNGI